MFTFDKEVKNINYLVASVEDENPSYGSPQWEYMPFEEWDDAVDYYLEEYRRLKHIVRRPVVRLYKINGIEKLKVKTDNSVEKAIKTLESKGYKVIKK